MRLVLIALFLFSPPLVAAQLYRWVDSDGKVHYTDQAPDAKVKNVEQRKFGGNVIDTSELPYATRRALKNFPVTLYANDCGEPCKLALDHLSKRGIPFERKTIKDQAESDQLKKIAGGLEVPTLVVGKTTLKGFQSQNWDSALDMAGYPKTAPYTARKPAAPAAAKPAPAESKAGADKPQSVEGAAAPR